MPFVHRSLRTCSKLVDLRSPIEHVSTFDKKKLFDITHLLIFFFVLADNHYSQERMLVRMYKTTPFVHLKDEMRHKDDTSSELAFKEPEGEFFGVLTMTHHLLWVSLASHNSVEIGRFKS